MAGTIVKNRVKIPNEVKEVSNRDINSAEIFWEKNEHKKLVSHVVKTSKGKKDVIMLSTREPLLSVTDDDKKNPALIKLYDFTKGGTDIMDEKIGFYSVKTKTWRWPSVAFS